MAVDDDAWKVEFQFARPFQHMQLFRPLLLKPGFLDVLSYVTSTSMALQHRVSTMSFDSVPQKFPGVSFKKNIGSDQRPRIALSFFIRECWPDEIWWGMHTLGKMKAGKNLSCLLIE